MSSAIKERFEIDFIDWPRCTVCQMPVEDFYAVFDSDVLIFIASCHNDTERVEISAEIWNNATSSSFEVREAFSRFDGPNKKPIKIGDE